MYPWNPSLEKRFLGQDGVDLGYEFNRVSSPIHRDFQDEKDPIKLLKEFDDFIQAEQEEKNVASKNMELDLAELAQEAEAKNVEEKKKDYNKLKETFEKEALAFLKRRDEAIARQRSRENPSEEPLPEPKQQDYRGDSLSLLRYRRYVFETKAFIDNQRELMVKERQTLQQLTNRLEKQRALLKLQDKKNQEKRDLISSEHNRLAEVKLSARMRFINFDLEKKEIEKRENVIKAEQEAINAARQKAMELHKENLKNKKKNDRAAEKLKEFASVLDEEVRDVEQKKKTLEISYQHVLEDVKALEAEKLKLMHVSNVIDEENAKMLQNKVDIEIFKAAFKDAFDKIESEKVRIRELTADIIEKRKGIPERRTSMGLYARPIVIEENDPALLKQMILSQQAQLEVEKRELEREKEELASLRSLIYPKIEKPHKGGPGSLAEKIVLASEAPPVVPRQRREISPAKKQKDKQKKYKHKKRQAQSPSHELPEFGQRTHRDAQKKPKKFAQSPPPPKVAVPIVDRLKLKGKRQPSAPTGPIVEVPDGMEPLLEGEPMEGFEAPIHSEPESLPMYVTQDDFEGETTSTVTTETGTETGTTESSYEGYTSTTETTSTTEQSSYGYTSTETTGTGTGSNTTGTGSGSTKTSSNSEYMVSPSDLGVSYTEAPILFEGKDGGRLLTHEGATLAKIDDLGPSFVSGFLNRQSTPPGRRRKTQSSSHSHSTGTGTSDSYEYSYYSNITPSAGESYTYTASSRSRSRSASNSKTPSSYTPSTYTPSTSKSNSKTSGSITTTSTSNTTGSSLVTTSTSTHLSGSVQTSGSTLSSFSGSTHSSSPQPTLPEPILFKLSPDMVSTSGDTSSIISPEDESTTTEGHRALEPIITSDSFSSLIYSSGSIQSDALPFILDTTTTTTTTTTASTSTIENENENEGDGKAKRSPSPYKRWVAPRRAASKSRMPSPKKFDLDRAIKEQEEELMRLQEKKKRKKRGKQMIYEEKEESPKKPVFVIERPRFPVRRTENIPIDAYSQDSSAEFVTFKSRMLRRKKTTEDLENRPPITPFIPEHDTDSEFYPSPAQNSSSSASHISNASAAETQTHSQYSYTDGRNEDDVADLLPYIETGENIRLSRRQREAAKQRQAVAFKATDNAIAPDMFTNGLGDADDGDNPSDASMIGDPSLMKGAIESGSLESSVVFIRPEDIALLEEEDEWEPGADFHEEEDFQLEIDDNLSREPDLKVQASQGSSRPEWFWGSPNSNSTAGAPGAATDQHGSSPSPNEVPDSSFGQSPFLVVNPSQIQNHGFNQSPLLRPKAKKQRQPKQSKDSLQYMSLDSYNTTETTETDKSKIDTETKTNKESDGAFVDDFDQESSDLLTNPTDNSSMQGPIESQPGSDE